MRFNLNQIVMDTSFRASAPVQIRHILLEEKDHLGHTVYWVQGAGTSGYQVVETQIRPLTDEEKGSSKDDIRLKLHEQLDEAIDEALAKGYPADHLFAGVTDRFSQ